MSVALVLHPDGDIMELNLPTDIRDNLLTIRKAIGATLIDVVRLTEHLDMWIDDEGLYTQVMNPVATALAYRFGFVWQNYHGPVVLAGVDSVGSSIDLTRDQLLGLLAALSDIAEEV
ncbi:DUF3846 domain-containing protein [Actinomadura viridis]|uniref:DUF3846 domain-containing protein n=1 Tax=Actinomadura viridis TaxID=58110 RepID=UPI0036801247